MGQKSRVIFRFGLGALVCALLFVFARESQIRPGSGSFLGPPTVAVSRVNPTSPTQLPSFEERLQELPAADWKNTVDRTKRAAILIEWLAIDRNAAMRFMSQNHYKDLWLPGITKAIGERATASELLDIANVSDDPFNAVFQVGRWDSPGQINEFASLMPSVNATAAGPTAGAIGSLLANINIDSAKAFAMGQATDQLRISAISGVMNELSSQLNGEAEIGPWYKSLQPSIQTSDKVLAAYGISLWASDPATALQTLQGISDPHTKMIACLVVAKNSSSSSPETAIAAIYQSGLSGDGLYNHVNQILQDWYAVNPQAAASFLSTTQIIPPSDLQKYAPITSTTGAGKG